MASKTDFASFNCSLAKAVAITGEGWSMLILRDAVLGARTFGDFQKGLGIATNILSDRLKHLVENGVLERSGTKRPNYRLTTMGWDLMPVLVALMQWGDRWLVDGKPPMLLQGPGGAAVDILSLKAEGGLIKASEMQVLPGPGAF